MAYDDEDNSFLTYNNITSCITHVEVVNDALNKLIFLIRKCENK